MEKLDLCAHLVETFKNSIEKWLLNPGVDTADIIIEYAATIKAMRLLEKSQILLHILFQNR
jgi:hypothetical protein